MGVRRVLTQVALPVVVLASGLVVAPAAQAASTLDQNVPDSASNTSVESTKNVTQSFTAGLTGALTSIDIALQEYGSGGDVTVGVYAVDGSGKPTGAALASTIVPPSAIPPLGAWSAGAAIVNVAFSPAPQVIAGTQYAYVIAAPNATGGAFYSAYEAASPYTGGAAWFCTPNSCTWSTLSADLGFRTYVDTGTPLDLTLWQKAYARAAGDTCDAGWSPSWMQWPNGGTGGFVCVKNTYAYHPDLSYVD